MTVKWKFCLIEKYCNVSAYPLRPAPEATFIIHGGLAVASKPPNFSDCHWPDIRARYFKRSSGHDTCKIDLAFYWSVYTELHFKCVYILISKTGRCCKASFYSEQQVVCRVCINMALHVSEQFRTAVNSSVFTSTSNFYDPIDHICNKLNSNRRIAKNSHKGLFVVINSSLSLRMYISVTVWIY